MPRKPNYSYERFQRETAKAAKREAKRAERAAGNPEGRTDDDRPDADAASEPSDAPATPEGGAPGA